MVSLSNHLQPPADILRSRPATTGDSFNAFLSAQLITVGTPRQKSYSRQGLRWDDSLEMSAVGFLFKLLTKY